MSGLKSTQVPKLSDRCRDCDFFEQPDSMLHLLSTLSTQADGIAFNLVIWLKIRFIDQWKMVRKLKYHEEKLLKKVDFMNWPVDNNLHEAKVMRKFHIRKREDYTKYVLSNVWHLAI